MSFFGFYFKGCLLGLRCRFILTYFLRIKKISTIIVTPVLEEDSMPDLMVSELDTMNISKGVVL